jgi:hypothetical protein
MHALSSVLPFDKHIAYDGRSAALFLNKLALLDPMATSSFGCRVTIWNDVADSTFYAAPIGFGAVEGADLGVSSLSPSGIGDGAVFDSAYTLRAREGVLIFLRHVGTTRYFLRLIILESGRAF